MIYRIPEKEVEFDTFDMVFGGTLNRQNRWVVLAGLISWDEVEEKYSKPLCSEKWSAGTASASRAYHQEEGGSLFCVDFLYYS